MNCLICKKPLLKKKNGLRSGTPKSYKKKHAVTCSKECSKIYKRVFNYLAAKYQLYEK